MDVLEQKSTVYFNSKTKAEFYHYYSDEFPNKLLYVIKKSAFGDKYELKNVETNTSEIFDTFDQAVDNI